MLGWKRDAMETQRKFPFNKKNVLLPVTYIVGGKLQAEPCKSEFYEGGIKKKKKAFRR